MFDENERVGKYTTDRKKKRQRTSRMEMGMGIDKGEDSTTALFAQRRKKKESAESSEYEKGLFVLARWR